jgi:hypothetical protein
MKRLRWLVLGCVFTWGAPAFSADEPADKPVEAKAGLQQSVGRIQLINVEQRQLTLAPQAQQIQVQQSPGKSATPAVFVVDDVTIIGVTGDKGVKGKPRPGQDDVAVKPKPKPRTGQDEPAVKPKPMPNQDDVAVKPKPRPDQDEPAVKPKPMPTPSQDDVAVKPKPKPMPNQDDVAVKPKPKPRPGQDDVAVKPKPRQDGPTQLQQGSFEALRVGQIVRIRFEAGAAGAVAKAVEIQVLKDVE